MTFQRDIPRIAPEPPYNAIMICMAVEAVPFALEALRRKSHRYSWLTMDDYAAGRRMLAETGMHMLLDCGDKIVAAVDRVYMLIDRNENGTVYDYETDEETGAIIPSPAIPPVPNNPAIYSSPGSKWQTEDLRDMLLNVITGIPAGDWVEVDATNPLLIQIRDLLGEADEAEQLAVLRLIAAALGVTV